MVTAKMIMKAVIPYYFPELSRSVWPRLPTELAMRNSYSRVWRSLRTMLGRMIVNRAVADSIRTETIAGFPDHRCKCFISSGIVMGCPFRGVQAQTRVRRIDTFSLLLRSSQRNPDTFFVLRLLAWEARLEHSVELVRRLLHILAHCPHHAITHPTSVQPKKKFNAPMAPAFCFCFAWRRCTE